MTYETELPGERRWADTSLAERLRGVADEIDLGVDGHQGELSKLWRGELSLRRTYWLYWFCVAFLLGFCRSFLEGRQGFLAVDSTFWFYWLLISVSYSWGAFMVVPLWRSASRYNGRRVWAALAKLLAISNATGAVWFAAAFWYGFVQGFLAAAG